MKRILLLSTLLLALVGAGIAQRKPAKDERKAEQRQDKREKEITKERRKTGKEIAKETRKSSGFNRNGSPDMRLAANKRKAEEDARKERERVARERERETAARARHQTPVAPRINPQPVNRSGDRIVGRDAKGRTLYEGPRGGRYYINSNGNKEYVKQ
jgi:colicin import membrane protein